MPMAMAADTRSPQKISWIVLQSARLIIGYTRSCDRELWPQSPWTNLTSQSLYWTTSGSLRPGRGLSPPTAWGSRDARKRAVGSKVARTKPNRRNDAIRRTGIEYARRRATYENIWCLRYADHDVAGARHWPGPGAHMSPTVRYFFRPQRLEFQKGPMIGLSPTGPAIFLLHSRMLGSGSIGRATLFSAPMGSAFLLSAIRAASSVSLSTLV